MVAERTLTTITGIVAATNPKGLRLEGSDGWANYSKWATLPESLPERGDHVVLKLDASGYVRCAEVLGAQPAPAAAQPAAHAPQSAPVDRETRITRSACLNTAVNILTSQGPAILGDVLEVAELLEQWVTR